MTQNTLSPSTSLDTSRFETPKRMRIRSGLVLTLLGLFVFLVGAKPNWFGWDRSPVVGFVQIIVFLVGLGLICLGGYVGLLALWKGAERTIAADIGLRLVGTGYIISIFAGMADIFGLGSHSLPQVPYFGPLQSLGVLIGEIIIALGFLLMVPFRADQQEK